MPHQCSRFRTRGRDWATSNNFPANLRPAPFLAGGRQWGSCSVPSHLQALDLKAASTPPSRAGQAGAAGATVRLVDNGSAGEKDQPFQAEMNGSAAEPAKGSTWLFRLPRRAPRQHRGSAQSGSVLAKLCSLPNFMGNVARTSREDGYGRSRRPLPSAV